MAPTHLPDADRQSREIFIAAKRHDLRTPINAIIGYSEMLIEDAEAGEVPWFKDLQQILAAGQALLATVDDRLSADKMTSGEIDVGDMAGLGEQIRLALRNDISAVLGYTEMILEDVNDLDEVPKSDLRKIHSSATRMTDLINEIVEFRTDAGALEDPAGAPPALSGMVHDVAASIRELENRRLETAEVPGHLLVVDDDATNRDLLGRRLAREGHTFSMAEDGEEALKRAGEEAFDVILLDIMMPVLDGYQTLSALKDDAELRDVPVIMLSALDQADSIARCIEMGADDFLPKPFDPVVLRARIGASLEKKRLRDREKQYLEQLRIEREQSERLLLNILPAAIAERLKNGEGAIADHFPEVTVLFSDLVGFTAMSARISAATLVKRLNDLFSVFDALTTDLGVEKVKTIGDAYMVVGGLPEPQSDHAERIAEMGLAMISALNEYNDRAEEPLDIRIGINTGPVVAGVIGSNKFAYDLWGDTVNTASRMESTGVPGRIQVSDSTHALLEHEYGFEHRGKVQVKGKGELDTFLLLGKHASG